MKVYTDSTDFADSLTPNEDWRVVEPASTPRDMASLVSVVFCDKAVFTAEAPGPKRWCYLFAAESSNRSQYDLLIEQRRQGRRIPDGLLCVSGPGSALHGLRQRPWAAEPGNIHLSVHLLPGRSAIDSGIPFMVLAAVSVVDAIDNVPGLAGLAEIKWVNDILLRGAKVAGVLAYSEGAGRAIDAAVLGIGLNVETTPVVAATPFVPDVSSLRDHAADAGSCNLRGVFRSLVENLDRNYQRMLDGKASELIERYRQRSIIVGRDVEICVDDAEFPPRTLAAGRVEAIGDNLELHLKGRNEPVSRGRLILKSEA